MNQKYERALPQSDQEKQLLHHHFPYLQYHYLRSIELRLAWHVSGQPGYCRNLEFEMHVSQRQLSHQYQSIEAS